ncbi:unnamed protein product [marine sediment metagenome]|uniref:Uncharacterized protein n=1 Tax=marine sediment metagenome TaxID=412755 RepID=X0WES1_9ZZZZ
MGENPYGCGYLRCPKCGETSYIYGHSFSEGDEEFAYHYFHCWLCNYENERETYPELQPFPLSPELEKIKEFKDALTNIHSEVTTLHDKMMRVFHSSNTR